MRWLRTAYEASSRLEVPRDLEMEAHHKAEGEARPPKAPAFGLNACDDDTSVTSAACNTVLGTLTTVRLFER